MATIGVMDSGVGGLSVLKEILRVLPKEQYIYFADNAFSPYGEKTASLIVERCRCITDFFLSRGVQAMVLACNTATAAAVQDLRDHYTIPFIGMEPAVKPAALGTKTGVVGVLATAGTLKGSMYLHTRDSVNHGIRILEHVGEGFVELVERGELTGDRVESTVRASLEPLLEAGADIIVLGCTHYPFLIETLQKVAGQGVRFIDPAPAVASRLVNVLSDRGIPTTALDQSGDLSRGLHTTLSFNVSLHASGSDVTLRDLFRRIS